MAFPMLAGTLAMNAYTLTDTWFISRLGTLPLAAMGFTFPVIMLLTCMASGLGSGMTALVSHAIGRNAHQDAARFVTHGLALTIGVSVLMALAGYVSIHPIFARLGADAPARELIAAYMRIWYLGALTMSLPMIGNGVLISAGDSRNAGRIMMVGPLLNAALNPLMIFGYAGFPAMGIRGSALATVIAQAVTAIWILLLLLRKHRLLAFERWPLGQYLDSFRSILDFGIPAILSMMLMPISGLVITRLLGNYGNEAVAAAGAAGRIEMFAFVIPMALGISLTPFVSQNFGAKRLDRIHEALKDSTRFALLYGGGMAVAFFLCAPWLAAIFSDDPQVVSIIRLYIRIISFGYGMMEVHRYCGFVLTGLHKPAFATLLNAIRVLALLIPLSCLGAYGYGVRGIFWGRLATDLIGGTIGLIWVHRVLNSLRRPTIQPHPEDSNQAFLDATTPE